MDDEYLGWSMIQPSQTDCSSCINSNQSPLILGLKTDVEHVQCLPKNTSELLVIEPIDQAVEDVVPDDPTVGIEAGGGLPAGSKSRWVPRYPGRYPGTWYPTTSTENTKSYTSK